MYRGHFNCYSFIDLLLYCRLVVPEDHNYHKFNPRPQIESESNNGSGNGYDGDHHEMQPSSKDRKESRKYFN